MPTDETVLGFSNHWYAQAAASAMRLRLPSGKTIKRISAPAFLATKFEAFHTRGKADLIASHDFEDIVNVIEGRTAIVDEAGAGDTAPGLSSRPTRMPKSMRWSHRLGRVD